MNKLKYLENWILVKYNHYENYSTEFNNDNLNESLNRFIFELNYYCKFILN